MPVEIAALDSEGMSEGVSFSDFMASPNSASRWRAGICSISGYSEVRRPYGS